MIQKVVIKNFRCFKYAAFDFGPGLNILVGDNASGKSTILEAINLALTCRWHGQHFSTEFSEHFINRSTRDEFLRAAATDSPEFPPEVLIELYLDQNQETAHLIGRNNSLREDSAGIRLRMVFDDDYLPELQILREKPDSVLGIPTDWYRLEWTHFGGQSLNPRATKVTSSFIDASRIRLKAGTDYYLQKIISEGMTPKERLELIRLFRLQQKQFAATPEVIEINRLLAEKHGDVSDKHLTLEPDAFQAQSWDKVLSPHLDSLPVEFSGTGEQNCLKILLALSREVSQAHVLLIEEPENHLSYSSLNQLVSRIAALCDGKQLIISTHSSFVVNKLGLDALMLLSNSQVTRLSSLPSGTRDYFKKLPGHDTLRIVLAKAAILVEGPSDELVVEKAYRDSHDDRRPLDDGIDIISVRGISFPRYLDIARLLGRRATVVADNDGDPDRIQTRLAAYNEHFIKVCISPDASLKTLEPQLVASISDRTLICEMLGREFATDDALLKYLEDHKTDFALAVLEHSGPLPMPEYICEAVSDF